MIKPLFLVFLGFISYYIGKIVCIPDLSILSIIYKKLKTVVATSAMLSK